MIAVEPISSSIMTLRLWIWWWFWRWWFVDIPASDVDVCDHDPMYLTNCLTWMHLQF